MLKIFNVSNQKANIIKVKPSKSSSPPKKAPLEHLEQSSLDPTSHKPYAWLSS